MTSVKVSNNIKGAKQAILEAQRRALTTASEYVESEAKMNANPHVDTGRLQGSITYRVFDEFATVGTIVEYAPYIEFGTGIFAEKGDGRKTPWRYLYQGNKHKKGIVFTRGARPYPFLRPAIDNNKNKIIKIIKTEMSKVKP